MHKLHYRIKNILPCKTGRILLVFNSIVSVVFTATAFLTQKAMQLFGCCNPLKDKLSGGFTVKYYLTKKAMQQKVALPFQMLLHTPIKRSLLFHAHLCVLKARQNAKVCHAYALVRYSVNVCPFTSHCLLKVP